MVRFATCRRIPRLATRGPGAAGSVARATLGVALGCWLTGCVAPPIGAGAAMLTALPNPSPDGAYRVSWTPLRRATRYRLHENGVLSHEGSATSREYIDKPPGSYTYVLTVCVLAFDFEACSLRPAVAPLTVVVADDAR